MKRLKIQFWKAEQVLAMQILEQEGLPRYKEEGFALICDQPALYENSIDLRGRAKWANLNIPCIEFNTNVERDEYLQKAVDAITDELFTDEFFTGEGEPKVGEMCEVRDNEDKQWERRKLIAVLPEKYDDRFIAEWKYYPIKYKGWRYARPIAKRIEPTVEECGNVITYTWEEK